MKQDYRRMVHHLHRFVNPARKRALRIERLKYLGALLIEGFKRGVALEGLGRNCEIKGAECSRCVWWVVVVPRLCPEDDCR
jgi:hypothetical protein